nr:odorant receptor [Semanotus bifasciatus]
MEKQVHMKFARILMIITGIWPLSLSGYKHKLYSGYFYLCFTYYVLFSATMAAMVFIHKGNFLEMASNLNISIIYFTYIYKVLICKSAAIQKIIHEIGDREKLILQGRDESIKVIYNKHVKSAFISMVFYIGAATCAISLYWIKPLVANFIEKRDSEKFTVEHKRYLIYSSWLPFDSDEHYITAYLIQCVGGFYAYAFVIYSGAFYIGILEFIIGQIKILQYIFRNLNRYIHTYSKDGYFEGRSPQEMLVKLCIREHQYLIGFVERLDESIKIFMLMEFMISSFQLSLVVYQFLQGSADSLQRIAVSFYFITLSSKLFLVYWNAHDIIIESTKISEAVFESEWYNFDPKVKKMLMLVIQRAQKPMGMSIGPFYEVRLEGFIAIFKAIYSYMTLIQN